MYVTEVHLYVNRIKFYRGVPIKYNRNTQFTVFLYYKKENFAECGIRTHETEVRDLKTRPFDRSGNPAGSDIIIFNKSEFLICC